MKKAVIFVFVVICCPWANGQKSTPADPFGLSYFGFERKFESRPLVTPSSEPALASGCGTGVYLREETATVNKKARKIKVVIVYFLPNPNTLATFGGALDRMKPSPTPLEPTNVPPGFSSLMFLWPPKLRVEQSVLLMRTENVNGGLRELAMDFPARLDVQEGDTPSILWKFDGDVLALRPPEILGNTISSNPALLKISFPRGAKKCIEGK